MSSSEKVPRSRATEAVRQSDIEPYTALRWVGTLFKAAAIFLAVAILGEFIAGLRLYGATALPELLGQLAKTIVLAVVLWGGGDLVRLLIQLGNDIRAERILLSRLVHRTPPRPAPRERLAGEGALDSTDLLETGDAAEDEAALDGLRARPAGA
jgi:hypothetical protein